jgi:uncharacterized membrane protein YfcA
MQSGGAGTRRRAALLALGLLAGFASALFGIGGGLVMVPVLTLLFDVPVKRAVGTSLAAIIFVSAVGVAAELVVRPENVRWFPVVPLTVGSLAGAQLGARIVRALSARGLARLFALFVAVAGLKMLGLILGGHATNGVRLDVVEAGAGALLVAVGFGAGLTASLFGVGGGIVIVPALTFFSIDIPLHAARATSLVTILPTSLAGTLLHRRFDHVDGALARLIVPLAFAGSVLGVLVANQTGEIPLARTFGVFLLAAAVWLFVRRSDAA